MSPNPLTRWSLSPGSKVSYDVTFYWGMQTAARRIIIAGKATVTEESAKVFADHNIVLIGNESQTVGPEDGPAQVHYILLGAEVVLLEGLALEGVAEGKYLLCAQPLNLKGSDGSPCRAILLEM